MYDDASRPRRQGSGGGDNDFGGAGGGVVYVVAADYMRMSGKIIAAGEVRCLLRCAAAACWLCACADFDLDCRTRVVQVRLAEAAVLEERLAWSRGSCWPWAHSPRWMSAVETVSFDA